MHNLSKGKVNDFIVAFRYARYKKMIKILNQDKKSFRSEIIFLKNYYNYFKFRCAFPAWSRNNYKFDYSFHWIMMKAILKNFRDFINNP